MTDINTKRMLIILLICTGLLLMGLRLIFFDEDRVLSEDSAWSISLADLFETIELTTEIHVQKPKARR